MSFLTATHAAAQPCAGDCDGSGSVTVDELVIGVNIALGLVSVLECSAFDSDQDGRVTVNEIIGAVDRALEGCVAEPMLRVNGTCLRPGTTGLLGCNVGTAVRGYRCDDRATCTTSPAGRTLLSTTTVDPPGSFTLFVSASAAAGALMMFEADVDDATVYRTFDFGSAAAGGARTGTGGGDGGPALEVLLAPDTEAAVRLLEQAGLHRFTDQGILDVIRTARIANIGTSFSGLTPAAAAARAFDVASEDPGVQEAIEEGMGPTPTVTPTAPNPTVTTNTPTPTSTLTRTHTPTNTMASTNTSTPAATATRTPTITATATFTQNPVAIDFGPAGGIPGGTTSLPLQLQSELSVARMDLNVVFSATTFAPESCGGDDLTVNVEVVGEGLLQLEIIADPPRVFAAGTFMECVFTVIGGPGTYPVSLSGTITGEDSTTIPVVADGTFEIDEECMNDEDCVVGQERCDDGICVPLPSELGALVTYFGLLTASNQIIEPSGSAQDGTPIFEPATGLGFGFFIVIEASQGLDGAFPGSSVFPPAGRPDVQIQSDRNLGNGSLQVCDANGIPGINPTSFDPDSTMITNALRDFGCRFELKTVFQPCQGGGGFIDPDSDAQVCTQGTVTIEYVFPAGDTRLTVRWRDQNGVLGPPASIIVRVPGGGPE